jgi:hypothetical protein
MPIHLTIQAEVFDIRSDIPRQDDIFLVDTNVWLWQTYTNAIASSPNAPDKIRAYTPYLSQARRNGATLVYSGLILAELAHVIEKTERQIYNQQTRSSLGAKEYRHNNRPLANYVKVNCLAAKTIALTLNPSPKSGRGTLALSPLLPNLGEGAGG